MKEAVDAYLRQRRAENVEELMEFLRIPSISTSVSHHEHIREAANWLAKSLEKAGLEHVEVQDTEGHPVVYGDWLHAPGQPTVLVYGHYDVQPPDPLDEWTTPPFEPSIRDDKIYARGATDDKAQLFLHIKAVEAYLQTYGKLPVNIKFCIEGEEEMGSPHLDQHLQRYKEQYQGDLVVISDGPMLSEDTPSLCVGLRGICAFELEVQGPNTDLHSGLYGGGVANPLIALVTLLASMRGEDGKVTIEGFYDKVHPLSESMRENFRNIPIDEERIRQQLGVEELTGEAGFSYLERTTARPTLEIHGIVGGYQGEGVKTVIPAKASAKLTCRLVDEQDPDQILQLIEAHVKRMDLPGVKVKVIRQDQGKPFVIPPDHPFVQAAARSFEHTFGKKPVLIRSGGSIPIVATFSSLLDVPVVMMDFGLPNENMHAPDEHFHLEQFDKGLRTITSFYEEITV